MVFSNIDITDQVNGAINTFTTPGNAVADDKEFIVFKNGQKISETEVTKIDPTSFSLAFIPKRGDNLETQNSHLISHENLLR